MNTGIIRRIDDLGRVNIPKIIREELSIDEGDPLEISIENGKIVLQIEKENLFLLSEEEYQKYEDKISCVHENCWLSDGRSILHTQNYCTINQDVHANFYGIRPAIKVDLSNFEGKFGDRIIICDFPCIVIDIDLVITEVPITFMPYDKEKIQEFLDKWYEERRV